MRSRSIHVISSLLLLVSCSTPRRQLVVYASEDQVFSEPILRDFEKETGIEVRAVYDRRERGPRRRGAV